MTAYLAMPDAVNVNLLPAGYPAYLGYADGAWPTVTQLSVMFPEAHRVILTVTGNRRADGCDVESGDLTPATGAAWCARELKADPAARPVIYASIANMPAVLGQLALSNITRAQVRLLSAHYGRGPHICGPDTCNEGAKLGIDMDGTQWTDSYDVGGQAIVDMSILRPDFFQTLPAPADPVLPLTGALMHELGIVRHGDTGQPVRTVQALCSARGVFINIDGVFGDLTMEAVAAVQAHAHLTADGVVGPLTWPVLLGVA